MLPVERVRLHNRSVALRFNSAPGWPVPPVGWFPDKDWSLDPSWPPMPPGWHLVEIVGHTDAALAYGVRDKPPLEPRISAPPNGDGSGQEYDETLLPAGFNDRGLTDAEFSWWESRFYDAVRRRDNPLCQALAQGEIDRVADQTQRLHREMSRNPEGARQRMPELRRGIDQIEKYLHRVLATIAPYNTNRSGALGR